MKKSVTLIVLIISIFNLFGQSGMDKGKIFYESKKYDEAEKVLKTVTEKNSDYAAAQYYLGKIALDKKEYDAAADFFEEATESNPKSSEYFNALGDAYAAIGGESGMLKQMSVGPKALSAWEKAAELDPKNIKAHYSLFGAYTQAPAIMGGGTEKANAMAKETFALLDESLKKTPDNYLHLYWHGRISAITGMRLDQGEACLKKYVGYTPKEGEPSVAGAYMRLGQINEKLGNKAEAKKYFEMALKLDSKLKGAQEGLERTSK